MLDAIAPLVRAGFSVLWLHPRTKRPIGDDWSSLPTRSLDELRTLYKPGNNVGVRLGSWSKVGDHYLHVVDVDVRDQAARAEVRAWLSTHFTRWREYPTVISGSGTGSRHIYFLADRAYRGRKLARSTRDVVGADGKKHAAWEVELFGTGKQVAMPPSIHPDTGKAYVWEREFEFDLIDLGIVPLVTAETMDGWGWVREDKSADETSDDLAVTVRNRPKDFSEKQVGEILNGLPEIWREDYHQWVEVGMALHHQYAGSERGLDLWHEFSRKSGKYDPEAVDLKWRSFHGNRHEPVTFATLFREASLAGLQKDAAESDESFAPSADAEIEDLIGPATESQTPPEDRSWMGAFDFNEAGIIKPTLHNLELILANDPRTKGIIEYNLLLESVIQRKRPGRKQGRAGKIKQLTGRVWTVGDKINGDRWDESRDNAIRAILEAPSRRGGYGIRVTDRDLSGAIDLVAQQNRFHPVQEYLRAITWDGVNRLDRFFIDYFGAADTPYHREAATKFFLAGVTRAFEPGHKFDYAPIIEGPQGQRKSTAIAIIGRNWFGEINGNMADRKAMVEAMQGKWVCELPELIGVSKSEVNEVKAFVAAPKDTTRLAYDRRAHDYKRQCIFMGSTNDRRYLRDDTGNRRFWPIACPLETIDTIGMAEVIDQVWAEAFRLYQLMRERQPKGTLPLYLTGRPAQIEALDLQADRKIESSEDGLAGTIAEWLDKPAPLSTVMGDDDTFDSTLIGNDPMVRRTRTCLMEIWIACLNGDSKHYPQSQAQLIGRAMRLVSGWESKGRPLRLPKYGLQRPYYRVGADPARLGYEVIDDLIG